MPVRVPLVVVLLALLAVPATASASPTQESMLQDDDMLLHSPPARVDATLDELRNLGIERVRLSVLWRNISPAERPRGDLGDPRSYPHEQFDPLDHVIRSARHRGIEVLLNVRGGAPAWALAKRRPKKMAGRDGYKPSVPEFGRFTAMLGRRYDGSYRDENQGGAELPRVTAWSIWNEPNWGGHLQPQSQRVGGKRRSRVVTVAPRWYRGLYRAAVDGLRATGHGDDIILIGETAPIGNRKLGELSHLRPLRFLRDLFCLNRRLRPLRGAQYRRQRCDFKRRGALPATGYAHHPYSVTQAPSQPSSDRENVMLADSARLERVLDAAARAGRIPAGLPLWYTEFGYQTSPPDPFRGVPLDTHAAWLAEAELITWANPRVAALTQFLLRDDEPWTEYAEDDKRRWITYQTGLRFDDGRPKPAYDAYRIPLVAEPGRLWGMVRPAPNGAQARIQVEYRQSESGAWQTVGERGVSDPRGYFTEPIDPARTGFYRVKWVKPRPSGAFGREPERLASRAVFVSP